MALVALSGLFLVLDDVLLLQVTHALDLVQIHNETLVVAVFLLDALTAEDCHVVRAVEMLHSFRMNFAQLLRKRFVVLVFKRKADFRKDVVFLHNLVQDVDVQWQAFSTFELLDQFAANRATHSIFVVQLLNAVSAEGVTTVNKYARDSLTHVVLEGAELTDIKATRLVVEVHNLVYVHDLMLVCKKK